MSKYIYMYVQYIQSSQVIVLYKLFRMNSVHIFIDK